MSKSPTGTPHALLVVLGGIYGAITSFIGFIHFGAWLADQAPVLQVTLGFIGGVLLCSLPVGAMIGLVYFVPTISHQPAWAATWFLATPLFVCLALVPISLLFGLPFL